MRGVPDAKTIWLFCETLSNAGIAEKLFGLSGRHLEQQGLRAMRARAGHIFGHQENSMGGTLVAQHRDYPGEDKNRPEKSGP